MPISADDTELYLVEETVPGTTPANPVWMPLPVTSESLATNANTTISNTLNPQRQVVDSILTGMDVSGSLEGEFARTPAMDLILESLMASTWDESGAPDWTISVEKAKKTFSIMKRWPDEASPGEYFYQIYKGCTINTGAITITAGAEVTSSFGIVGETVDANRNTIEPAGSTYDTLSEFNALRAPEVIALLDTADNVLGGELDGVCVTDTTININANVRGIQCLGTLGNKSVVLGRFEVSVDMSIFFNDNNIMEEFLKQSFVDVTVNIGDLGTPESFQFVVPKGKISSETVVAEGTGTDVVNALTVQGLVDATLTPQTSLLINTIAYGTNAPSFESGVVENASPSDVVVTFSENVAIVDSTGITILVDGIAATISTEVATGPDITFTLSAPVTVGQSVTFQADGTNNITDVTDGLTLQSMSNAANLANNTV